MSECYPSFLKRLILPVAETLKGMPVQKFMKEMEEREIWSPGQIREFQLLRLKELLTHSYDTVPYYHELFDNSGLQPSDIQSLEDLTKIPFLTKEIIREHLSSLISRNSDSQALIADFSSGSTGEPLKFFYSKKENALKWASFYRGWKWAGYDFGTKTFIVWGNYAAITGQTNSLGRIKNTLLRSKYFNAFDFRTDAIPRALDEIVRYRPSIIYGYSSALYIIAKYMEEKSIYLSDTRAVITTSETLHQKWREVIQKHFNCKVYDSYGVEGAVLAQECQKGGLHLNADNCIVEFVSVGGGLNKIVFTNLNNYAMPFIRYDVYDLGTPSDKMCSCGRGLPLIESIEGRIPDILVTPKGRYLTHNFFIYFFESMEGIDQFQIVQEKPDEIIIKIVPNKNMKDLLYSHIAATIQEHIGPDVNLVLNTVPSIPPSRSGKKRFVISKCMESPKECGIYEE